MPHTPGPWKTNKVTADKHTLVYCRIYASGDTDWTERTRSIGFAGVYKDIDAEANAALIAAAPELLEALKACLPYLPTTDDTYNSEHPVTQQARAAIAKASADQRRCPAPAKRHSRKVNRIAN